MVEIDVDEVRVIGGAGACLKKGIFSTINDANLKFASKIKNVGLIKDTWKMNLLADPQTS